MSKGKYTKLEDVIVYQRAMELGEKINQIIPSGNGLNSKRLEPNG